MLPFLSSGFSFLFLYLSFPFLSFPFLSFPLLFLTCPTIPLAFRCFSYPFLFVSFHLPFVAFLLPLISLFSPRRPSPYFSSPFLSLFVWFPAPFFSVPFLPPHFHIFPSTLTSRFHPCFVIFETNPKTGGSPKVSVLHTISETKPKEAPLACPGHPHVPKTSKIITEGLQGCLF